MLPRPEESPLYIKRYGELTPEERGSIQIYERCNKSVVNVDTRTTYNVFLLGELDEPGAGSGIVLDKEGHILTNSHVVNRVDSVTVTLYNGESYPAELIGEDIITDLAVVKIKAPADTLFPAVMSNSSDLLVGQKVFAIGNPYGLERTFTSGLISSLNRSIPSKIEARSIKGVIQIDAAINPGNSGGILLDSQGRMIGINTAIASHSGGSDGIGFAIPANTVSRIVPQLLKSGKVVRGNIGIMKVREVERDKVKGLLVISMMPDGAAEKAGLQGPKVTKERALFRGSIVVEQPKIDMRAADIITGVNGIPVKKADDFTAVVDEHKPGDQMILDVLRKGKQIQVPITLE
ncbi:serine protease [Planctomycetales bacterium]|nr:serine protease [Planctomycetales bacterium]GHT32530.1 serine protease [Planctomycetales bacterium]